jgi:hypothetical protein
MSAYNMHEKCGTDCKCHDCGMRYKCGVCIDCEGERFSSFEIERGENYGYVGIDEECHQSAMLRLIKDRKNK